MPLTLETPKPLLELSSSQTILSRIINQFQDKVNEIFINISYLPNRFTERALEQHSSKCRFVWEPEMLGSQNTLYYLSFLTMNPILVVHGDLVLSDTGVSTLLDRIRANLNESLMVVHNRQGNTARSIVFVDPDGKVLNFKEGVDASRKSNSVLSNSGIYFFTRQSLQNIQVATDKTSDLTGNLIQALTKSQQLYSFQWNWGRISIDSIENLAHARELLGYGGFE